MFPRTRSIWRPKSGCVFNALSTILLLQNKNHPCVHTIYFATQKTWNYCAAPCIQYTHMKIQQRIRCIVHVIYKLSICLWQSLLPFFTMYFTVYMGRSYGSTSLIPLGDTLNISRFTILSSPMHIQNSLVYPVMNYSYRKVFSVTCIDLIARFNVTNVADSCYTMLYIQW